MDEEKILYFRPQSREELEKLMSEHEDSYLFLTGGDYNAKGYEPGDALIDLQDLGLDTVESHSGFLVIGGLVPLERLFNEDALWTDFRKALSIEGGWNIRNGLSLDNFMRVANGRSPLLACLRALDMDLVVQPDIGLVSLDEYLGSDFNSRDCFIERVEIQKPHAVAYEQVARSPKDLPIVCVATVLDDDGTLVVTVGGHEDLLGGLVFEDGEKIDTRQVRALFENTDDEWASADYRQDVAETLLKRCLAKLPHQEGQV